MTKEENKETKKKETKKRELFRARMAELTFSDCEATEQEVLEALTYCLKDRLKRYQIVRETHNKLKSGVEYHHIHCFVEFDKSTSIPMVNLEKRIGRRPHFSSIRNPASFLGYIAKEAKPLGNFDLFMEAWNYSGSKAMLVKSMLNAGWNVKHIISKFQDHLWTEDFGKYVRKYNMILEAMRIDEFDRMLGIKTIDREMIESHLSPKEIREYDSFEGYSRLVKHLNDINKYGFRQLHVPKVNLLIRGNTAIGKSRLFSEVMKYVPTYEFPIENWHPDYEDGHYRLIVWDEPKMKPALREMYLKILDGLTCNLPVKGSHAVRQDHQKIVLLSNSSLDELADEQKFKVSAQREAFKRRLDEIDFGDRRLDFLHKLLIINK